MPIDVLMPQLSPTMTEGRLAKWTRKPGDKVSAGDVLAEVETDKATMEIEAIEDGTVHVLLAEAGADIAVGTPIAVLQKGGEKIPADYKPQGKVAVKEEKAEVVAAVAPVVAAPAMAAPVAVAMPVVANVVSAAPVQGGVRGVASPLARKLAKEKGVDVSALDGSGPRGRVVAKDVLSSGKGRAIVRRPDAVEKLSPMRKAIAGRLTASKQTIPHFYLTRRADLRRAMQLREELNSVLAAQGVKVSVNDMIIKACGLALARHPAANAAWNGDSVVLWGNVDISVAVAIEGGLITPIVQNADAKGLPQISTEMKQLAADARAGKLKPAQYEGGGFSISNLGMYGIETFSAIVNPPQAAILAVGAAQEDGKVSLTLSVDHRVIDGALGAELLADIVLNLEQPTRLVL